VISSPLISGLTSKSPPYTGLPSTALTATASTSAFLDLITLASDFCSVRLPCEHRPCFARGYFAQLAASIQGLAGTSYAKAAFNPGAPAKSTLGLTQPPYGTSMPQSGRRPQHQTRKRWAA